MRFTPRQREGQGVEIDITAMVDVVFLLIVFFLTTSSMVELTRARLDLPQEPGEDTPSIEPTGIVINIERDGSIIVENDRLSMTALLSRIDAAVATQGGARELELLIRADRASAVSHINELATGLMDRGVRGWRIATEVPPEHRKRGPR